MKSSIVSSGWVLLGVAALSATMGGAAGRAEARSGRAPGSAIDVYIPNPDAQTPIAWSQGTEPPPPQGDYGGGFLQYVITGNETRPAPHPRLPPPYYPARVAPVQGIDGRNDLATYARPPAAALAPARVAGPAVATVSTERRAVAARDTGPTLFGIPLGGAGPAPAVVAPANGESDADQEPDAAGVQPSRAAVDPIYRRQEVDYTGGQSPGTVLIDTHRKFLFLVEKGGRALRYGIGVGRPGFIWSGTKVVTRKAEWPDWTPPSEMLARRPDLPHHMDGGIANPLGARAMYLGSSLYRIHGTNEPETIGTNVSSGCIRLNNEDVIDLYSRVGVGTRVVVL